VKRRTGILRRAWSAIANFAGWSGAYSSTDTKRKILEGWAIQRATANQALGYNIPTLVNQCRHLERNCPSARSIVEGLVADIIGTGIDVAPDTGSEPRDEKIRKGWLEWAECAAVDGTSLWELQAQSVREIGSAGAFLWRFVILPERTAEGNIPLAILPLEVEWLSAQPIVGTPMVPGSLFVNGVEMDKLGRPIAYHIADPNTVSLGGVANGERVDAKYIVHGFEKRRAFQTQGEPILAPLIERLQQEEDLVRIELQGAKISAGLAVAIESEYHEDATDEATTDPQSVTDISPGTVTRLFPGEKASVIQSSRPNQLIEAFRKMLRGDLASAARCARKWLDRDYSSATFMNTRMEQADSKRMHKPTQNWLGRHIASRPYLEALPWLLLKNGTPMPADAQSRKKLQGHRINPDLPEYVDPLDDGKAAIQNATAGLSSIEEECASRGKDYRKNIELNLISSIEADKATVARISALAKSIAEAKKSNPDLELEWSQVVTLGGATSAPGAYLDAIASAQMSAGQPDETGNAPGNQNAGPGAKDPSKKPVAAKPKPEAKAETDDE
jgi:lambda family phage portal protein